VFRALRRYRGKKQLRPFPGAPVDRIRPMPILRKGQASVLTGKEFHSAFQHVLEFQGGLLIPRFCIN
jgi:hypothetical protein